jgi:pilus assembly protein CpaF
VTDTLLDEVRARLVGRGTPPTEASVAQAVRDSGAVLAPHGVLALARRLRDEMAGTGPLEALLADPAVTDVVVNGPGEVFIDRGSGLERCVGVRFADADEVRRLAVRLAAATGRRLDDAVPWVDASLPDGTRLHAVLPPLAPDGPLLSLRVLARRRVTLDDLVSSGAIAARALDLLTAVMRRRLSLLVTGGTGVGKTTVLAALLSLVDPIERIVLVEDTAELAPEHPHVVRLVSRAANVEGAGAVGLDVLVRQSLRMRPDRIVVGEVRGAEVVELLAALNTGHDGCCGTVHANTSADLPARLEALGLAGGLTRDAVHSQVAAGLHVVVHLDRAGGRRRLSEVSVVAREGASVAVVPALVVAPDGQVSDGPAAGRLARSLGVQR